ncbi:MAG: hypothetical protein ABII26_06740 [Pseudomonadota bacterium]
MTNPTLCFPDHEKSCFACCPPIRPAGYEHIQYKNIINRFLRENTEEFGGRDREIVPITGLSCWALGFVDKGYKRAGCLLHPDQNGGMDLRYRVDYGDKCRREICPEERTFSRLGKNDRVFWLHLADGLDSFSYSSRKENPLLNLMNWGNFLLSMITSEERYRPMTGELFFRAYPFFLTPVSPKANAYLINQSVTKAGPAILKRGAFAGAFERFSRDLTIQIKALCPPGYDAPHTHRLGLDGDFLNFLRLSPGIRRIDREGALMLKGVVDEALIKFIPS